MWPYEQASIKAKVENSSNADEATCTLSSYDYSEIIPGIQETKQSLSTILRKEHWRRIQFSKRGRVKCSMSGRYLSSALLPNGTTLSSGNDTVSEVPMVPITLSLERATSLHT
jgi:hypothetical protein